MESFSFYFGLNLGCKLYAHTDNLSKTLQKEKMSAISGKELADLTTKAMQGMRNDRDFDLLYETVTKSASSIDFVSTPTAPRKRKRPKYEILQFLEGNPRCFGEAYYPETAHAHFKAIYFEAIDVIVSSIKERFEQPAFKIFTEVEQLLLKSISKKPAEEEMKTVKASFCDDFDDQSLPCELELLPAIFHGFKPVNFSDVVDVIQSVSNEKRKLIKNVIIRLVLTMGATSATPERSFSTMSRLKTWLRSTMSQKRFNAIIDEAIIDTISLIDIANEFVSVRPSRQNIFEKFTESDL